MNTINTVNTLMIEESIKEEADIIISNELINKSNEPTYN